MPAAMKLYEGLTLERNLTTSIMNWYSKKKSKVKPADKGRTSTSSRKNTTEFNNNNNSTEEHDARAWEPKCSNEEPEAGVRGLIGGSESPIAYSSSLKITLGNSKQKPKPMNIDSGTAESLGESCGTKPKKSGKSCSSPSPIIPSVHQDSCSASPSPSNAMTSSATGSSSLDAEPDDDTIMKLHASAIGHMTNRTLSMHMNPSKLTGNDWKGLADYMGFSMLEIQNFELNKDPMEVVLREWVTRRDSTIGSLIEMITDLEREDVLMALQDKLKRDAKNFLKKQQQLKSKMHLPVQVPVESSHTSYPNIPITPELRGITLNDWPDGPIETFDAYVCHNPDTDYTFVLDMLAAMEKPPYNLRFCTDWRDLVPGGSYATATAELIENRCKRMIVVLSPEFLQSGHCDFQAKFALALSPGARKKRIVPVMLQWCDVPSILKHITMCDFTKEDMRPWFWQRLYGALMQE